MVSVKMVENTSINLDYDSDYQPSLGGYILGMIIAAIPAWVLSLTVYGRINVVSFGVLLVMIAILWFPISMVLMPLQKRVLYFKVWSSSIDDVRYIEKTGIAAEDTKAVCQVVKEFEMILIARKERQEVLVSIASKCK